ncbi:hypothetical protein RND81_11G023900 [Saponaria officinalis]|uniref:Secreted protein n=1 Tax=Saponaria officinalis TaxID=3572 RepID=A0AAW1HH13_SAPOF
MTCTLLTAPLVLQRSLLVRCTVLGSSKLVQLDDASPLEGERFVSTPSVLARFQELLFPCHQ